MLAAAAESRSNHAGRVLLPPSIVRNSTPSRLRCSTAPGPIMSGSSLKAWHWWLA